MGIKALYAPSPYLPPRVLMILLLGQLAQAEPEA